MHIEGEVPPKKLSLSPTGVDDIFADMVGVGLESTTYVVEFFFRQHRYRMFN